MKKVTIEHVAREAGVSITTVSRVINKTPSVSPANRLKVEEAVRKLKFKPNTSAQRLAGGKTNTIALVIPRYSGVFHSFYAIEIIRALGTACERMHLDLLLHLGSRNAAFNFNAVDGIIFADIIGNEPQLEEALKQGIPSVVINKRLETNDVNCIYVDNKSGAYEAVSYLISSGHKSIAHITGDVTTQAAQDRLKGYKKALEDNSISLSEKYILKGDYSRNSARLACEKIIKLDKRPTGIFVSSDDMAMEVISALAEKGIKTPRDISIVGFDDDPIGLFGQIRLTTVHQPLTEMCEKGLEVLLYIISGKPVAVKHLPFKPQLVIRDSVIAVR